MPGENGIEATKKIKLLEYSEDIYIIGCSGYAADKEREKCLSAGMSDYMQKPVNF